ncbi:MAG: hypothetical protein K0R18_442 [Bacillales bacterium]|jgi:3D (Asp-Asp-Asp) domain-containing protein|nr:hypothetical protein [Bacillales bacterium]
MKNPAANRRTQLNPNALPVSRKKFYIVAIGSAALILFSSLSMWVMGKDLTERSRQLNEVVGQFEIIKQESTANKQIIEDLKSKVALQEQSIQQLTVDNEDLTKKYRERRDALEKKRLTIALGSEKQANTLKNLSVDSSNVAKVKPIQTNNINEIENTQPTGVFNASFYTPKCVGCTGKTASGAKAQPGVTIAVDTRYWELGTKFYVEGFGVVIAQDTGGAIKGKYRVDICVSTTQEALKLGNKQLKFWVLQDN